MERIVLNGTNTEVTIVGDNDLLSKQVIEALNNNFILDEVVANNELEVNWLYGGFNYIQVGGHEYLVIEGEETADNEAIGSAEDIMLECGLSDNLIFEAELQGLIDTEWFIDAWDEIHTSHAYDESIKYIATDEELEQLEEGEITEDEIRDNLYNSLQESIQDNEMDEYKYQFGEESFHAELIQHDLIDTKALSKWCVDMDGRGHYLSSYNGEEIQEGELFLYRTN